MQYGLWQVGLLSVVTGTAFVVAFVAFDLLIGSGPASIFLGILCALVSVTPIGVLFHYPSDVALPVKIYEAQAI